MICRLVIFCLLWSTIAHANIPRFALYPPAITNRVELVGVGTNSVTGNLFLPQTPEAFTYDLDGNLTSAGRWTNTWNGDNQLISMQSLSSGPAGSLGRLDFTYDFAGRRIQKIVSTNNAGNYTGQSTNRFVYDGWNLIAILDPASTVLQTFRWGTDLSGSMQGAAGVGGLVSITVHSGTNAGVYFYCFDGNGNVTALVNATNGAGKGSVRAD